MSGLTLFELDEEIRLAEDAINEYAEQHDGDFTECPFTEILDKLEGERSQKILNIAAWYKELSAEAKAVKSVEIDLTRRRKALENKAEGLKSYIRFSLSEGEKLKDARSKISWTPSKSVEVHEMIRPEQLEHVNSNFVKVKKEPDKTYLKEYIKDHGPIFIGDVEAAKIQENLNLQIK